MENVLCSIRTLTALHCGIGQGVNDIDLPVARHPVSGHPVIPGSSLKGVLKDEYISATFDNEEKRKKVHALFGGVHDSSYASAISLSDGVLLCLPVRSFYGTFAYLASPYTLQMLKNECNRVQPGINLPAIPPLSIADPKNDNYKAIITGNTVLKTQGDKEILLEELDVLVDIRQTVIAEEWAAFIGKLFYNDQEGRELFSRRFAIVDDNVLNFITETALPVDARIAIDDETGTVKKGALWYEETVPAETLFTTVVTIGNSSSQSVSASAVELIELLTSHGRIHCQIGGKSTTGKGFSAVDFHQDLEGSC
ncbi:type III-B CRISPR module RAMP protein Cmr4 [Spirochaeta dissipatitropha]